MAICVAIVRRSASVSWEWRESTSFLAEAMSLIEQVIGFDAETFASADLDVGAGFVFFA